MLTVLRPRLLPNCTAPAARANSVSSPPRPTSSPGWNLVPRWRIRISPALTCCPPKRLTPKRCAWESRPFRELDAPFLCAIANCLLSRGGDAGHLDLGQRLAVPLALVVPGLVLELVDPDLRALGLRDDLTGHRDVGKQGRVGHQVVTVDEEHRGERHRVAGRTGELLDLDHVALGDLVLLAAGLDDRVHRTRTPVVATGGGTRARQRRCRRRFGAGAQQPGARVCAAGKGTPCLRLHPNRGPCYEQNFVIVPNASANFCVVWLTAGSESTFEKLSVSFASLSRSSADWLNACFRSGLVAVPASDRSLAEIWCNFVTAACCAAFAAAVSFLDRAAIMLPRSVPNSLASLSRMFVRRSAQIVWALGSVE